MSASQAPSSTEFKDAITPGPDQPALLRRGRDVRRTLWAASALVLLVCLAVYVWHWWTVGRFLATTDDAYLAADAVTVAPRVSGYVAAVLVGDNERVHAGQVLVRIDDRTYRAALAEAEAQAREAEASLQIIAGQVAEQQGTIAADRAEIERDQARLRLDALEQVRADRLSRTDAGTREAADRADSATLEDTASLRHDQAALAAAGARLSTLAATTAYAEAAEARAIAGRNRARIDLDDTVIRAPVDGVVGDRTVRAGNDAQPGLDLLTVVPMGRALYVTANFKETQLKGMRPGQPATLTVDAEGGHVFHGHVDGFSPGTGSEFALLPPENATGNFTKIVQRVPVRISLDGGDPAIGTLRAGLSAEVTVATGAAR